jgi:hypothetical protein
MSGEPIRGHATHIGLGACPTVGPPQASLEVACGGIPKVCTRKEHSTEGPDANAYTTAMRATLRQLVTEESTCECGHGP